MAEQVDDLLARPGADVTSGIYARDDGVHLRFSTRGEPLLLAPIADAARSRLGDAVWGTDDDDLAAVALAALGRSGATSLASWEADTHGALLALLAATPHVGDAASYLGGVLDAGGAPALPVADSVLQVALLPQDASGRSRVRVALTGHVNLPRAELRIHGSGEQRLRRAAFAALNEVRLRL